MNPDDIIKLSDFINLKRAFRIGSRGCSLLAQYFNNEWHLYIERADLTMSADIISLICIEDEYKLLGLKNTNTYVFVLDLERYIKFTDMSFIRVADE